MNDRYKVYLHNCEVLGIEPMSMHRWVRYVRSQKNKLSLKIQYIPVTPVGTLCDWLAAGTESEAWKKLMVDAVSMPYRNKQEFINRGYTVQQFKLKPSTLVSK